MMATYALTVIIALSWVAKMILNRQVKIHRTPFDIPIFIFLASQIISTIFSIDRHVSLFGYYSRFNGGLLSIISYIILYYAFVTNFPKERIRRLLLVALGSGLLISLYGILEHFGIDKNIWVQDVQNRVFSTLGQPNWLAAYLAVLIPITISLGLDKFSIKNKNFIGLLFYWVIASVFYITLIFTKSRSGFAGFWIVNLTFWALIFLKYRKKIFKIFIFLNFSFLIFNFIFGSPFSQFENITLSHLLQKSQAPTATITPPPAGASVLETGITESGTIRKIVWKGAIDIMRHYPLFGSGVETFAYSYYKYRPVEHNMTSEWDFLYNKAHNEYLNYGATTGIFGLGTYLLFITIFIIWFIKTISKSEFLISKQFPNSKPQLDQLDIRSIRNLSIGLFTGWLSILITNFLGFSVVIIQIFFYLLPAISVLLISHDKFFQTGSSDANNKNSLDKIQIGGLLLFSLLGLFLLFSLTRMWLADVAFARGYNLDRAGSFADSFGYLKEAITLNPHEILYYDEISLPAAELSVAAENQKETTLSGELRSEAIGASNLAISEAPNNVNFFKTRTRVFYALSALDPKFINDAIISLTTASLLSPTDPKIAYNLGLLYGKISNLDEAIKYLQKSSELKPDYKDAHFALALFYKEAKKPELARQELEFILTKISTDDAEAKKQLDELNK